MNTPGYSAVVSEDTIVVVFDGKPYVKEITDGQFSGLLSAIKRADPATNVMKFFPIE